ncbi:MAG TPA: pyruvate, water dikinase regulatory protein [Acidobacteriota bacterium]|nr:kinase/pyrophosphorylase [Acidobacteriota bacterium]HOS99904.1 pyruvate, water dikinase regulatory protein [Acidobacteriota bacterium]HQF86700.1 pyruvate, water dikinase regulatory protein [Acidobacteriota bacterium]HQG90048.1 pyruvate, water dikinase regulatory protein [Acidobacteriota bacterium]
MNPGLGDMLRIFVVSDATGRTCHTVVQAALSQFNTSQVEVVTLPHVRTFEQIEAILDRADRTGGVVVYTMVAAEFRQRIYELGRLKGVPTVDILGPVLTRFSDILEVSPLAQPGLFRQLDQKYFKRIEAVDYTIKHDDGVGLATLDQAEIVLLGVSRTSKTPVSIYLAYRGWKAANVPVVLGQPLPEELFTVDPRRVVALTINPDRLQLIRQERARHQRSGALVEYTDPRLIGDEVAYGVCLYRRHGWPIIDVTFRSIEETATEAARIMFSHFGAKRDGFSEVLPEI